MKHALVIRNIVDLRDGPDFQSELKTQLLFGERVMVHRSDGGYTDVEQSDGCRGWVRFDALGGLNEQDAEKLDHAKSLRVVSPIATVMDESGAPITPYFLSYGSIVYPAQDDLHSDTILIACPDARRRTVHREDLCRVSSPDEHKTDDLAESIICSCVQFLGAPYVWGGRSALGMDCSGLTQLVYGMHGVDLPRDTKDQRLLGQEVKRDDLQPGYLIFSPGHVVIYIGGGEYIHASLGEGGVEINSYDTDADNYRKDLDEEYQIARRHW